MSDSPQTSELYREYRQRILQNDDYGALETIRRICLLDPSDKNAARDMQRRLRAYLGKESPHIEQLMQQGRMEDLQKYVLRLQHFASSAELETALPEYARWCDALSRWKNESERKELDDLIGSLNSIPEGDARSEIINRIEEYALKHSLHYTPQQKQALETMKHRMHKIREQNERDNRIRQKLSDFTSLLQNMETADKDRLASEPPAYMTARLGKIRKLAASLKKEDFALPQDLQDRLDAVIQQWEQARKTVARKRQIVLRFAIGLAIGGIFCGGLYYHFSTTASRLTAQFRTLMKEQKLAEAQNLASSIPENSILHTFSGLDAQLDDLHRWIRNNQLSSRSIACTIAQLEMGTGELSAWEPAERTAFEQSIDRLPPEYGTPLKTKWRTIIQTYERDNGERRNQLLAQIQEPGHTFPTCTGNLDTDGAKLHERKKQLSFHEQLFLDNQKELNLAPEILLSIRGNMAEIDSILKSIAQIRDAESSLRKARTLEAYKSYIRLLSPSDYPPLKKSLEMATKLPKRSELTVSTQFNGNGESAARLARSRSIHLDGQPTFTPNEPIGQKQLDIIAELFHNRNNTQAYYRILTQDGQSILADTRPVSQQGTYIVERSPLDPGFTVSTANRLRVPANNIAAIETIDMADFLHATGLKEPDFAYGKAKLLRVLARIANYNRPECPALAKAYFYGKVLDFIDAYPYPEIPGANFSESLALDKASFRRLQQDLPVELTSACWLSASPTLNNAENKWKEWFNRHQNPPYEQEVLARLLEQTNQKPTYVGFIDHTGTPVYIHTLSPDKPVWYIHKDDFSIRRITDADSLKEAVFLSPLISIL